MTHTRAASPARSRPRDDTRWWGFALYAAVSLVHVVALTFDLEALEYPTKLTHMPVLALAVVWALRGALRSTAAALLLAAIAFSWLGDGAALFFPFLGDELPAMLLCFGIAHLLYIGLFLRPVARRPFARWSLVYAAWWAGMMLLLWPSLGALAIAVAVYGLVLGGTAAASTRGSTLTAVGGAFFLASDSILAMRLFLDGVSEPLAGPWIMITYTIGQGLLALGIVRLLRHR